MPRPTSDREWVWGTAAPDLSAAGTLRPILDRSLDGTRPTVDEVEALVSGRPQIYEVTAEKYDITA